MKVGTVFIWREYQGLINEGPKNVYGVYLGESGFGDEPPKIFFHKLTSRIYFYEPGAIRHGKKIYKFFKSEYPKLATDSIYDFEFPHESPLKIDYDKAVIEELFDLEIDKIRMIYNHIKEIYCRYEYLVKCRIHECFNNHGISGLEKPKKKNRRNPYGY